MRIFVINLKSSTRRKKIMERQLNKLKLPFEFFDAIQGSALSEEEVLSYYDKDYYNSRPSYFTPGAIGCTLSHFLIYKKIVAEKIESALILEDDMVLSNDLPVLLDKISGLIRDDEVILLFYQSYLPINLSESSAVPLNSKYTLYQVADARRLRSTGGYMINYSAAKTMSEKLLPFSSFPDDWKDFYDRRILNGIRILYPFILDNSYEATTISPNIKGGILIRKIIPLIERYKIFPFYQLLKRRRKINIANTRQCFIVKEASVDYREN